MTRRHFLGASALGTLTAAVLPSEARAADNAWKPKKAVKYAMIRTNGSIKSKFELLKKLGYDGVELDSPSTINKEEAVLARDETGIAIHGVVNSVHWRDTLSHPQEKVRDKGLEGLRLALQDARLFGADTVLLVPGVVNDEVTFQQCWDRSTAEIRKVLPLAEKLKIKIAIEGVWNNFLIRPDQFIQYVDQFKSPYVGAYFDCSNMLRYGVPAEEWIRQLDKRVLKVDCKGFCMAKYNAQQNPWVAIGDGDENWPAINKALRAIGYQGWVTAEVSGGGEKELREILERMTRVLSS